MNNCSHVFELITNFEQRSLFQKLPNEADGLVMNIMNMSKGTCIAPHMLP